VPGDPIEARVGEHGITPERLAELRHEFGYDQPLWKQFVDYELALLKGDFGVSVVTREPVIKEFAALFPATVELSVCADHLRHADRAADGRDRRGEARSAFDHGLMGASVTGASMPIFWWGLMMILIFSVHAGDHAGVGADLGRVLRRALVGLHADRLRLVGRRGRLRLGLGAHGAADGRAGYDSAGDHRAHDAVLDAGGAWRGLLCGRRGPRGWPAGGW
jgi:hypothetical protein